MRLAKHNHAATKRRPLYNHRNRRRRTRRHRGGAAAAAATGFSVYYGAQHVCEQKLHASQVGVAPRLAFEPAPNTLYTVLMYDSNVAQPEYLHWLVPNVRDPNRLFPTVSYIPPAPPAGTGYHTYMFELYEQPRGPLRIAEPLRGGPNFDKAAFLAAHGLRYVGRCGFYMSAEKN